jgi:predicted ester cyclase
MKALARRGAVECWKLGHLDELDEILAPDYKVYVAGVLTYNGRDAMKRQVTEARAAFPDVEVTVEDLIAQGDKVVARFVFRGTHLGEYKLPGGSMPPTGKRVEVTGIIIFRIANRLIVENREILDTFGMLQQLGVIPTPTATPG